MSVDPKILKRYGSTAERLREIFTASPIDRGKVDVVEDDAYTGTKGKMKLFATI